jgi:hypothetical protein
MTSLELWVTSLLVVVVMFFWRLRRGKVGELFHAVAAIAVTALVASLLHRLHYI